jgi:aryl-alcohol dehydrogenase-like predicted oxidoreductase
LADRHPRRRRLRHADHALIDGHAGAPLARGRHAPDSPFINDHSNQDMGLSLTRRDLGRTGLKISPLVFGGNVLGWTVNQKTSFDILDAFLGHGFNAIDTADVYTAWVPGNRGGESETIIGNWLKARPAARNKVVILTKVGSATDGTPLKGGLSQKWILEAADRSLARLGVDAIDVYLSHWSDGSVPVSETLGAYEKLLKTGKIKSIGASNVNAEQLASALATARDENLPGYQVVQPEYNLYSRGTYDGALRDLCIEQSLGVVTYYSLAAGFLSGKYRSNDDLGTSVRGARMARYLNPRGAAVLEALDRVAEARSATPAEVSLAWLMAREGVTAPIASATRIAHVESFAKAAGMKLTPEEMTLLDKAGA